MSTPDCGDNSCRYANPRTGMRTNGGCRCDRCPWCDSDIVPSGHAFHAHRASCPHPEWTPAHQPEAWQAYVARREARRTTDPTVTPAPPQDATNYCDFSLPAPGPTNGLHGARTVMHTTRPAPTRRERKKTKR